MWLRLSLAVTALSLPTFMTAAGCPDDTDPTPTATPDPNFPQTDMEKFEALLDDLNSNLTYDQKMALTQDFLNDVQYSGGFPMMEGNSATFVYLQQDGVGTPIRVAGDFNNWNATQYTLTQSSGFPLFYTTVTLSDPNARSLYKFIGKSAGSDVYVADPVARRFQWDTYGQYSLIAGGETASHLERYPAFYADELGNTRDLFIYLPAGYEEKSDRLPVLYMHDGQNLFDPAAFYGGWQADDVADQMIKLGQIDPLIMVGMANTPGRMEEYTHCEDFLPAYGGVIGGDGPLYSDMIVDQVKPFMDMRYRTAPGRADTGVLGSSLGGIISYYIGWAHPETFRFVGGMSSTFGWGKINMDNDTMIDILADTQKRDQIFYVDSGGGAVGSCEIDTDGDGIWDDNTTAEDNYCETLQMKSVLQAAGYKEGVDLFYVWAPGQEHNEASWHDRMDDALRAFVGK